MLPNSFHPAVHAWFHSNFAAASLAQSQAWPLIKAGRNALIAAPTGSGKTLAAFLAAIDTLVWQSQQNDLFGQLPDQVQVVYVSPLKALSNDIHKNLEQPLVGIRQQLSQLGYADAPIRTMVRTGDTSTAERVRMRRQPPHILVTTPESLFILLTAASGRAMLSHTRCVIIDEIHALAGNKRGAHLALSIERLTALCAEHNPQPLLRIGLSATQKPLQRVAQFLTGQAEPDCAIIDAGHVRPRDLGIEVTGSPLEAVMSAEAWQEVYRRLAELILSHTTTLIFVNTRRLAERLARHLAEQLVQQGLDERAVTAHHGSLSKEHRLDAEQRLKSGQLRALVATASLELGIDIGDIDLVCQIGSPRSISSFLQRVGRSGHAFGATPKGRLFPCSRDELVESVALLRAVAEGDLDQLTIPEQSLDVLAQQLVAEVAAREWSVDELYALVIRAWPYRQLPRASFDAVVQMLADGYSTRRGRRSAYLHYDQVNQRLRDRRGAALTAMTNGGAIPDLFDYDVILQPEGLQVGTVNEDFAFESMPGEVFQLGNTAYRILKVELGKLLVADAAGQPPSLPFWLGEAPGRSDELSRAVAALRREMGEQLAVQSRDQVAVALVQNLKITGQAAVQLVDYLAAARAALGVLPDANTIVFERFFDQAGDQHLVIHSCYGSRINRAWGLALRKRFCRQFNFELQAAALEDSIVLSLGSTHSFELAEVQHYLKAAGLREVLTQALLAVPMFATHWRWVANIALAVKRYRHGKRLPAQLQRMDAEDLLALVFPDQLACAENLSGEREVPEHPLVEQTLRDCLTQVMDVEGLEQLLRRLQAGDIRVECRDLLGPSPLAEEILTARPYAFLDDAPAEERRTQMVQTRTLLEPEDAAALGSLSAEAIAAVRAEAWPQIRDADELHDALMLLGVMTDAELLAEPQGQQWVAELQAAGRAICCQLAVGEIRWLARERQQDWQALHPHARCTPVLPPLQPVPEAELGLRELVRSRLQVDSPQTAQGLSELLQQPPAALEQALLALQTQGYAMRGRYAADTEQWCERGLLARMHRYTLERLRKAVQPVSIAAFQQFLFAWQGLLPEQRRSGAQSLLPIIEQLAGVVAPAAAWESAILPARLPDYWPEWLDQLCSSGQVQWLRRQADSAKVAGSGGKPALKSMGLSLLPRHQSRIWIRQQALPSEVLSASARQLLQVLQTQGALFFAELQEFSRLLPSQLENSLAELVAAGLVSCDSYAGLRALLKPAKSHSSLRGRRGNTGLDTAGRWVLCKPSVSDSEQQGLDPMRYEPVARALLKRYGVVFRKLLEREQGLPGWRELLYIYRRLEARGEVRGGRFVQGFSGEQFALPEALGLLRKGHDNDQLIVISAADPLNFTGILPAGERVAALSNYRIAYQAGAPQAALLGKQLRWLVAEPAAAEQWRIQQQLYGFNATAGLRRRLGPQLS